MDSKPEQVHAGDIRAGAWTAGRCNPVGRQQACLEDHLHDRVGPSGDVDDRTDVPRDVGKAAGEERRDVHHHVELRAAVLDRKRRFDRLHLRPDRAVRKRDDARDGDATAPKQP